MNSFKSFPPADDLLSLIGKVDWIKVSNVTLEGVDYFLEIVEQFCMFIAALATVLYSKWQENQVTTKLIKMAKVAYAAIKTAGKFLVSTGLWLRDVAYPVISQSAQKGYTVTRATWETVSDIYTLATSRQFVNL